MYRDRYILVCLWIVVPPCHKVKNSAETLLLGWLFQAILVEYGWFRDLFFLRTV